jgi:hypothetical protein
MSRHSGNCCATTQPATKTRTMARVASCQEPPRPLHRRSPTYEHTRYATRRSWTRRPRTVDPQAKRRANQWSDRQLRNTQTSLRTRAHLRGSSATRFTDGCATGGTIGGSCDFVPLLSEACRYDAAADDRRRFKVGTDEASIPKCGAGPNDSHRSRRASHKSGNCTVRTSRRAGRRYTDDRERHSSHGVSLGHQDTILGLRSESVSR